MIEWIKNYNPKVIGERIKEALGDRTQRWLAEATGLTEASICRYIQGVRVPQADTLAKLSKVLNVSADYLLGLGE